MDRVKKFFKSTAGMVLIVTILVGIIVHATTGNFFTAYNISTLTRAASFVIIVGFGTDDCSSDWRNRPVSGNYRFCVRYGGGYLYGELWNQSIFCHCDCQPSGNCTGSSKWIFLLHILK